MPANSERIFASLVQEEEKEKKKKKEKKRRNKKHRHLICILSTS